MEYGEHALEKKTDSEAVTYIQLRSGMERFTGVAINRDIVSSSLNALLRAVGYMLKEEREKRAA